MSFSKIQKLIGILALFFFFFNISISIPLLNWNIFAKENKFYDLVSIIVDEKTYPHIQSELKRYSKDISNVLENTKVVIIPVPKNTKPFNIASINEGLYFDGYKSLVSNTNFNSRLVGTILVGDISLPTVFRQNDSERTTLPYTDFENKSYIYNKKTNKYEKNSKNYAEIKPEIWHSFISPNTGSFKENINSLKTFFDKDHDFYTGKGLYKNKDYTINGDLDDKITDKYKPYVFYYDAFREEQSLNANSYLGYEGYLQNKEDLNYSRYTKELARKIKKDILSKPNDEIYSLAQKLAKRKGKTIDPNIINKSRDNLENVPDIQTRYIVNNALKKFIEVFSKGGIGEMRKNVFNAGRYNYGKGVNVDFIPYLLTTLDIVNDEILKELTSDLEKQIDDLVEGGLSERIIIPVRLKVVKPEGLSTYDNFLFGQNAKNIGNAKDCSFYRGSMENNGKLVEANRLYNIQNIDIDRRLLEKNPHCMRYITTGESLEGYWGKNSPFNLDINNGVLSPKRAVDYKGAIVPLFDIAGSKKVNDISKVPNPYKCFDTNLILVQRERGPKIIYKIPPRPVKWTCTTDSNRETESMPSFYDIYKSNQRNRRNRCEIDVIYLENKKMRTYGSSQSKMCEGNWTVREYYYEITNSWIKHKSPKPISLKLQIENKVTPDLPIDKNRYIDFIREDGNYAKINYPYLYRIKLDTKEEITLDLASKKLDEYLDKKSAEINAIINKTSTISAPGDENDIYDFLNKEKIPDSNLVPGLKTGPYPSPNFDLKNYLKQKGRKIIEIDGETKEINYYDILVFAIFWNNLKSASSKYSYIFENYLANTDDSKHYLPKKKSFYEIAYIGSKGTADKMFIGLDPNIKKLNPFADLIAENQKLSSDIFAAKVGQKDENTFKCAPPDGVPLWEWPAAIMCRLKNMLPPTIKISPGECSVSTMGEEDKKKLEKCNKDSDNDGVIDCLTELTGIKLEQTSDKYFTNSIIELKAIINSPDGKAGHINSIPVKFKLTKLEVKKDDGFEIVFDEKDKNKNDKSIISKYINFKDTEMFIKNGEATLGFSSKKEEVNAYFVVETEIRNREGEIIKTISSKDQDEFKIKIRKKDYFSDNNENIFTTASRVDVKLGSNYIKKSGAILTSFLTLKDDSGNIASGDFYTIKMSIDGDGIVFLNNKKEFKTSTYKGYKIFRLKSSDKVGDNNLKIEIFNKDEEKIASRTVKIKVIDDIILDIEEKDLKVGGNKYSLKLKVKDSNGNLLSDLNSRVYPNITGNYVSFEKPYFEIKNGEANIDFKTKILSGKDIPLDLQIEGINNLKNHKITIKPDKPLKIDLMSTNPKLEADKKSFTEVKVELKDRYDNLVFTDSSSTAEIEVPSDYSHIIEVKNKNATFKEGIASFIIYSTKNPGIGFYKVKVTPDLSKNNFTIGEGKDKITISGVSENAGKIETFYFWNKEKIQKKGYNSLYTTLLGSNYGDIERKDYLAGDLIFEKNSKALAVSSVISLPNSNNGIVNIKNSGKISDITNPTNLMQNIKYDVGIDGENLFLNIYNSSLGTQIGKIYYKFGDDTILEVCSDICNFDNSKTSIFGKSLSLDYEFFLDDSKLKLVDELGREYFSIDKYGKINKNSNLNFKLDTKNKKDFLKIDIFSGKNLIGYFGINFKNSNLKMIKNSNFLKKSINNFKNTIVFKLDSNSYFPEKSNDYIKLYYNDPFSSKKNLSVFSRTNTYSYENFRNKGGVGWKEGNKTLLSFAAGESVGNSLKKSMSFGAINIGDPVISLKKIKRKFKDTNIEKQFDSTIGKIISTDQNVDDYLIFDYNGDNREDILLIKNDKYLQLLENKNTKEKFIDMGNLAYLYDLGNTDLVLAGNFSGDSYDDVFFVGGDGKPYILNNRFKDFNRVSLEENFGLAGKIKRAKSFDMDNDSIDDIVTLDDSGEINIFYGNIGIEPNFTKKTVSSDFAIHLSKVPRADNSLVYFEGLYQIGDLQNDVLTDIQKEIFDAKIRAAIGAGKDPKIETETEKALIESIIFERLPYSTEKPKKPTRENLDDMSDKNTTPQVTFIKGEYAENAGLKVEKTFTKLSEGHLKSGDVIEINIKLTNTSSKTLEKIAYLEKIENYFSFNKHKNVNIIGKEAKLKTGIGNYNFMVDEFSLKPNESILIKYEVVLKPINYAYLKVGLFEKGEAGDDDFGDIIVQDSYKNCGKNVDIFRSIGARTYSSGKKENFCKNNSVSTNKDYIDTDNNGIPDYIDKLLDKNNKEEREKYSENVLNNMTKDSDGDGKPDEEDYLSLEDGKLTLSLGEIGEKIDNGLGELENLINSLSCGFNNGACISTPLNWAPLAPGSDPTFMGKPIGDGLNVGEGIPVFSALTGLPTSFGCIPTVFPTSVLDSSCSSPGAGGSLGINSPSNFFRLFVTPTLTGGAGIAACFGAPAVTAGYANMPGISPLFPGGNCVVVAKPILGCSNDGSDGDPSEIGNIDYNDNFGYINGNCPSGKDNSKSVKQNFVRDFIQSNGTNIGVDEFGQAVEDHSTYDGTPLISIGSEGSRKVSISIDSSSGDVDYRDVEEINKTRIKAFPAFLMDWMTRQIEEIVTKLTDFPNLFIILPDFSGVYDTDLTWEENSNRWYKNNQRADVDKISGTLIDAFENNENNAELEQKLKSNLLNKGKKINSGIKEAYEFIGSFPLVKVEEEPVFINVPWIGKQDIDNTLSSRKLTIESRKAELKRAKTNWTLNGLDDETTANKINLEMDKLISSLEKNIEIIEDYKNIPEKINELLNKKQERLEQILCNIESITEMMGGRIGENGVRFKAWVETFIMIKAILKSWQALIDIFVDYEAECKECKNERSDLLDFQFSIIDMIIPDIPVVKFPKWPDIVLDLHNIRALVVIKLPTFEINSQPIILPTLPELSLPDVPNVNIKFPELPTLPELNIPELPDIPSLPNIDLPDLPPPPKLPKLFAGFEFATDIAKLITKAMCILKMSPFVPEWRAGDQIAFLTERNGFLSFDFLNKSLPQFSLPFVDAIKVTTYVNLEYETDFIVELAKQIASPINQFSGDFSNIFDINLGDVDLSGATPSDIDIDLSGETGLNNSKDVKNLVSKILAKNIIFAQNYISENANKNLDLKEFKKELNKNLASKRLNSNPKFDEVRKTWKEVSKYNFSKEDKIIKNLKEKNREKFRVLKDIINTEIIKTKKQKKDFKDFLENPVIKVSSKEETNYNSHLKKYNDYSFKNLDKFLNKNSSDSMKKEIESEANNLLKNTKLALNTYNSKRSYNKKLLAANTNYSTISGKNLSSSSCSLGNGTGERVYKGIYIFENNRHYRLFDYLDELTGEEEIKIVDIDGDSDNDIFYMTNNTLYLKENLENDKEKIYLNEEAKVINPNNNKFLDNNNFIEAVNDVEESVISSTMVNINFSGLKDINNYRLTYYDIIDKFFREDDVENLASKNKNIVDGIAGIGVINLQKETFDFKERKNIAFINKIGDFKGIKIHTEELKNLKNDIVNKKKPFISNNRVLYTGNNYAKITYEYDSSGKEKTYKLAPNSNLEVVGNIRIVEITGDIYIKTLKKKTYYGGEISKLKGLPIFPGTKIHYNGKITNLNSNSYFEISYYDGSVLPINFKDVYSYELYDLGNVSKNYLFSLDKENDLYYGKISAFKDGIISTISNTVLSSPQIKADKNKPEININSIKIPVYQNIEKDITLDIFEDSGFNNISQIYIDFDLKKDSNGDGNTKNDNDSKNMKNLNVSIIDSEKIIIEMYFEKLYKRKIGLIVIDKNGNKETKEIDFEVYAPDPEINTFIKEVISGDISENLTGEPINIYRYRAGTIAKVLDHNKKTKTNTIDGNYDFKISKSEENLTLEINGNKIADINEKTGYIDLLTLQKSFYNIIVKLEEDLIPKIIIQDKKEKKELFYQKLRIKSSLEVKAIDNLSEIEKQGLYVYFTNKKDYNYYNLPKNIKHNPGSLVIHRANDDSKKPEIIIFKDGRIKLERGYKLSYSSYNNKYISFKILFKDKEIASVIYYVEGDYIIKGKNGN